MIKNSIRESIKMKRGVKNPIKKVVDILKQGIMEKKGRKQQNMRRKRNLKKDTALVEVNI